MDCFLFGRQGRRPKKYLKKIKKKFEVKNNEQFPWAKAAISPQAIVVAAHTTEDWKGVVYDIRIVYKKQIWDLKNFFPRTSPTDPDGTWLLAKEVAEKVAEIKK